MFVNCSQRSTDQELSVSIPGLDVPAEAARSAPSLMLFLINAPLSAIHPQFRNVGLVRVSENIATARRPSVK
jgi:hypothetical protein